MNFIYSGWFNYEKSLYIFFKIESEGELLIKLLSKFHAFDVSGKKLYLYFCVRACKTLPRSLRIAYDLRIESGIRILRYSGVKLLSIL